MTDPPDPHPETLPMTDDSSEPKGREQTVDEEGGARRRGFAGSRKKRRIRLPGLPAFRPVRTIIVLVAIVVILLLLIMHFGLGGGDGSLLPGESGESGLAVPEETPKEDESDKPAVRRELYISFFPSATDPDMAKELACNLDWTDQQNGSQESRRIITENMTDFEFELEKAVRLWRTSLGMGETQDIPVVAVSMAPFPGEGIFRKIESIARLIDSRISILRLETSEPAPPQQQK